MKPRPIPNNFIFILLKAPFNLSLSHLNIHRPLYLLVQVGLLDLHSNSEAIRQALTLMSGVHSLAVGFNDNAGRVQPPLAAHSIPQSTEFSMHSRYFYPSKVAVTSRIL